MTRQERYIDFTKEQYYNKEHSMTVESNMFEAL